MPILNSLFTWLIKKRIHQIELFIKYPIDVQEEWFRKLVSTAKNTEWGKKYDYASINTIEDYKNRVPVNDYNTLKPFIDRLRKGDQNLLWPSEIKWFAKSSGTTSDKSKFIPVSSEALEECHFKGGRDMLSIYVNNHPDSRIFSGKGLVMGGSRNITEVNNESYYTGDLSAILIQNLPFWAQLKSTPNTSVALMEDWESKIEKMATITITHDVTSISGVPSWTLVLFRRILEKTGKTNMLEVWPNLEVFFHGGVSFDPYRKQYRQLIDSEEMCYMETYNASEGFFGIQNQPQDKDMLLMLDYGIFYEFIPVEELDKDNPRILWLDEVHPGVNYAMLISTNAGLWRYMIGDTIMFTSVNPYKIKITGRTKNFINAFGEELIIDNAEKALAIACEKCQAVVSDYTAAPVYFSQDKKSAAHEWVIEFDTPPANPGFFAETLDTALKSLNSDYEAKRYKSLLLHEPIIRTVPPGTFYRWMKSRDKLGGQNKVPRLANERRYVEEILELAKGK
ncbi:MAG: GH3 auxin-responsive promoter family protein [Sphingobacteriia bacterium]|nr:GH3 auxin-responsive promoter family protein [Sphingobacteriia bacterium]